eukprot:5306061-Prymnesium_polylepis.1
MARTVPAGSSMGAVCVTWDEYAYPPNALGLTSVRQPSSVAEMVWFCARGARSKSTKLLSPVLELKATIMQSPAERAGAGGGAALRPWATASTSASFIEDG